MTNIFLNPFQFTLAKLLIDIFCLDKNSADAKKLLNYRSPNSASAVSYQFLLFCGLNFLS